MIISCQGTCYSVGALVNVAGCCLGPLGEAGVWFRAVVFRPPWGRSFRLQAEKEVSVPWSFFQRWNAFWGWALDVVFGLGASMLFWALGFDLAVWEDAGFSAWAWLLGWWLGSLGLGWTLSCKSVVLVFFWAFPLRALGGLLGAGALWSGCPGWVCLFLVGWRLIFSFSLGSSLRALEGCLAVRAVKVGGWAS
ncbi:hypothetical protein OIU74_002893, partial [Salix koriyanagi]